MSQDFDAFDTIAHLTAAQCLELRAQGVTTVLRYLAHSSTLAKVITPAEAQIIRASGLRLVLNWEQAADSLLTASTATLQSWAAEAGQAAKACGAPPGDVFPLSVDFDVSPAQWDGVVLGHVRAFDDVLHGFGYHGTTYGSGYACRRTIEAGFPPPWQAKSTGYRESATTVPGVALRQIRSQTLAGVAGDVNKIIIAGSWAGSTGGIMGQPQAGEIDNTYAALFSGGPSCGAPVDAQYRHPGDGFGNSVISQLAELRGLLHSNAQMLSALGSKVDAINTKLGTIGGGLTDADRQLVGALGVEVSGLMGVFRAAGTAAAAS